MVFKDAPHYLLTTMIKKYHLLDVYQRLMNTTILLAFIITALSSCKIYKPTHYFQDIKRDTVINGFVNNDIELKIQKDDILKIGISSLNSAEDALYNTPTATGESGTGFQVNNDGNIEIHKLGKIRVLGLSRKEVKNNLEQALLPYLKDPIVSVSFANHRVTVFGESSSKLVNMPQEKIALLDVMAETSPVTANSKLDQVMVIRETGQSKEFKFLNLQDPSIFTSPWYYLQPNDIVVIKPNEEKINSEQKRVRNQLMYTTVLSGITFVFLIIDRIFRN